MSGISPVVVVARLARRALSPISVPVPPYLPSEARAAAFLTRKAVRERCAPRRLGALKTHGARDLRRFFSPSPGVSLTLTCALIPYRAARSRRLAHTNRNPGGVRFGSAEIYDVLEQCFAPGATHAAHAITDCLVVGQSIAGGTDERVVLFVKLLEGEALSDELAARIRTEIRARRSPRHVPARVSAFITQ